MTRILVTGYGWTGSSALYDMFKEYKNTCVIPHEFDDFRAQNVIGDIVNDKLNGLDSIKVSKSLRSGSLLYILQFIIRGSVSDKLWPKKLKGYRIDRKSSFKMGVRLLKERRIYNKFTKKIISSNSQNSISLASSWIDEVIKIHNPESLKYIVFDQPIIYDNHSDIWPTIFGDAKLILICRNPLDQMGAVLRDGSHFLRPVPWKVEFLFGRDSFENRPIMFFMDTTKDRYHLITEIYKKLGSNKMLVVKFESLVNNYEYTKNKIEIFTGLKSENHINSFKYFDYTKSQINVNARAALCQRTLVKAKEIEPFYRKMIIDVNAI
jgi:hypothetical protein